MFNRIYSVLLAMLLVAATVSCQKDDETTPDPATTSPLADFSFTMSSTTTPSTVVFTNLSKNCDYYSWTFGDGSYSSEKAPSHTYTQSGTYTVTLKGIGTEGEEQKVNEVSKTFTLEAPAVSSFKITKLQLNFYDGTQNWDLWDDPDCYLVIKDGYGSRILTTGIKNNLGPASLPAVYTVSCNLSNINEQYQIILYDDDVDADDFMGGFSFAPAAYAGQSTFTISSTSGKLGVTFTGTWQ